MTVVTEVAVVGVTATVAKVSARPRPCCLLKGKEIIGKLLPILKDGLLVTLSPPIVAAVAPWIVAMVVVADKVDDAGAGNVKVVDIAAVLLLLLLFAVVGAVVVVEVVTLDVVSGRAFGIRDGDCCDCCACSFWRLNNFA